ncbi:MAG: site-specific integrase [Deltaproteobacteria bacterium]|nr:site-specific integrase [Deltaproteobacteria bacterium]
MGYYIRHLPSKKTSPQWKVQFVSYRLSDQKGSHRPNPKREWDIPYERWQALGFHHLMVLSEARARAKQLNAQRYLRGQEERLRQMNIKKWEARKRYEAFLPSEFVAEFENRFIRKRDSQTEQGLRSTTRAFILWNAAQKMIVAVAVDPSEWFYFTNQIYDYFFELRLGIRYIGAVIKIANLWGFFFSRKLARPFLPIPLPRGYERQRLLDAHFEKTEGASGGSKPISPIDLMKMGGTASLRNFNWIFLSVWFGLRPKEIDSLHDKEFWRLEVLPTGKKILWVYQTKIIGIPKEDRWKPIAILFDEQEFALNIVKSGNFKRPLAKTMGKYFGTGVTLYGGRKGFTDLMLSKNQSLENISVWMGHSTLQRTWRSYKQRRKFHLAGF